MGLFQGYTVRKSKLDDTDERCKCRWAFFRDTLSENQNWMIQMRGVRVDRPFFRDTLSENQY
jgi:hypothetical protein